MMKTWLNFGVFLTINQFIAASAVFAETDLKPNRASSIYSMTTPWKNEQDKPILISSFLGKPLILTLSYTSCKVTCPTTLRILKGVSRDLEKKDIQAQFVIISFDPKVDTPKKLAKFKIQWKLSEDQWHLLTGETENLEHLEEFLDFHVSYNRIEDHYVHDRTIYIFDSQGQLVKSFNDWDSEFVSLLANNNTPKEKQ